jgi:hypothetical protein
MPAKRLGGKWADVLRSHGVQSVPMDDNEKRPQIYTSQWWSGFPSSAMNELNPQNIAALPGLVSRLIVIDLDGPDELIRNYFAARPVLPVSWQVITSSGGRHMWYRMPEYIKRPISKCRLWKGDGKHEEILVLGDRSLATCPPSRYAKGRQYKWTGSKHPLNSDLARCPEWLVDEIMALQERPKMVTVPLDSPTGLFFSTGSEFDRGFEVHDKLAVLVRYGLRLATNRANPSGWIPCFRPGDDDRVPSASVRSDGSILWTSVHGGVGFWQALVLLGAFLSVDDAKKELRKS